jgi:hypothetical protein
MEIKDLSESNLEEILYECAQLRNVGSVPHRTVKEFSWFIEECLYGQLKEEYGRKIEDLSEHKDNPLRKWGLLFYDYCIKEYGDDSEENL